MAFFPFPWITAANTHQPKYTDNVRKKKKAERERENETIKASEWVSGKAHDEFGGKNNGQNQRGIKHF